MKHPESSIAAIARIGHLSEARVEQILRDAQHMETPEDSLIPCALEEK